MLSDLVHDPGPDSSVNRSVQLYPRDVLTAPTRDSKLSFTKQRDPESAAPRAMNSKVQNEDDKTQAVWLSNAISAPVVSTLPMPLSAPTPRHESSMSLPSRELESAPRQTIIVEATAASRLRVAMSAPLAFGLRLTQPIPEKLTAPLSAPPVPEASLLNLNQSLNLNPEVRLSMPHEQPTTNPIKESARDQPGSVRPNVTEQSDSPAIRLAEVKVTAIVPEPNFDRTAAYTSGPPVKTSKLASLAECLEPQGVLQSNRMEETGTTPAGGAQGDSAGVNGFASPVRSKQSSPGPQAPLEAAPHATLNESAPSNDARPAPSPTREPVPTIPRATTQVIHPKPPPSPESRTDGDDHPLFTKSTKVESADRRTVQPELHTESPSHSSISPATSSTERAPASPEAAPLSRESGPQPPTKMATPVDINLASRTQPARQISLKLTGADSTRVDVELTQKAGKVQVAVRTADRDLARSLQTDLGDLVGRLESKGYKTETWIPAAQHAALSTPTNPSNFANTHPQHSGSGTGQQPGQHGQHGSNQRQQSRWSAQFDENFSTDDTGLENTGLETQ